MIQFVIDAASVAEAIKVENFTPDKIKFIRELAEPGAIAKTPETASPKE